jgi:hypothetical protein
VFADKIEEHARRLDKVLQRFEKANLLLQPGKCTFALPQVNYLGYVVSRDGVTASPDKVLAVRKYPVPKNVKEVRSFLALASFYRLLFPRFAEIAKPMTQLIRKDTQFKWKSSQQAAFEKLKEMICSEQVLAFPDFKSHFILTTDASKVAVAEVLSQVQDGVDRPIAFASRQMNQAEQNYCASEAEMLAIIWATKQFRCYLYGKRFKVRTDHLALTYVRKFTGNNARLLRWSLRLSEFDFQIEHCPGTQIRDVDALSRHVQAVNTSQIIPMGSVKAEQASDKLCNSIKVGNFLGRSEYFYNEEGVIYRRRMNCEHQSTSPQETCGRRVTLRLPRPRFERFGSAVLYYMPEKGTVHLQCQTNRTSETTSLLLQGSCLLLNAARCSFMSKGLQVTAALQGESQYTSRAPVLFTPTIPPIVSSGEAVALKQMAPVDRTRLERLVTSISSHYMNADVNTLFHLHDTSQQFESKSNGVTFGVIAASMVLILFILYYFTQAYLWNVVKRCVVKWENTK